jgi:hypothetical protein
VRTGTAKAFRDLAVFLVIFGTLIALSSRGVIDDVIGLLWWGFVLLASICLAWKGWTARKTGHGSLGPGGWGAVVPPKIWRWMLGEDETESKR